MNETQPSDALRHYRRDVRLKIILPVALPFLALIGLAALLFGLAMIGELEAQQITIVMSIVLTICALIPLSILMLVLSTVAVLAAFGAGSLEGAIIKPLEAAREYTARGTAATQDAAQRLAEPIIQARGHTARWRATFTQLFSIQEDESDIKHDHPPTET